MGKFILIKIISILLGLSAFYLAYKGIEGWGWFLCGAIFTSYQGNDRSNNSESESN